MSVRPRLIPLAWFAEPPTSRQLAALNRCGALLLVSPDLANRLSKGSASAAISDAVAAGVLEVRTPVSSEDRFDRTCAALIGHIRDHTGCNTTDATGAVRGRRSYVAARLADLIDLGIVEDRAEVRGPRRRRELHLLDGESS